MGQTIRRRAATLAAAMMFAAVGVVTQIASAPPAHAEFGAMIYPVSGTVTGLVGDRCEGRPSDHQGVDIAGNGGTPIVAAFDGTVTLRVVNYGSTSYGNYVVITHASGYTTLYAHMRDAPPVAQGQTVSRGQQIGIVGNTGNSFGAHLHFELKRNGANVTNNAFSCGRNVSRGSAMSMDFPGLGSNSTPTTPPPPDRDGDGVPDSFDVCPDYPGFALYAGCGLPRSANSTDFDGNGKADVFYGNPNGQWWASDGGSAPWRILNTANIDTKLFQFADFNGDGKDDVFAPQPNGNWLVSYGGTSGWTVMNSAPSLGGQELQLGDFNGDGKADVFYANPTNSEWWVSYSGNTGWQILNTGVPATDVRIADFNGDGKSDVFYAHPNGDWWVSYGGNTGWQILNSANVPGAELKFGDLNGDGKDDVFWANGRDGRWWVSYGGNTAWTITNTANVPLQDLQLADVTGNGTADVFFPNTGAGAWWISESGTSAWTSISGTSVDPRLLVVS